MAVPSGPASQLSAPHVDTGSKWASAPGRKPTFPLTVSVGLERHYLSRGNRTFRWRLRPRFSKGPNDPVMARSSEGHVSRARNNRFRRRPCTGPPAEARRRSARCSSPLGVGKGGCLRRTLLIDADARRCRTRRKMGGDITERQQAALTLGAMCIMSAAASPLAPRAARRCIRDRTRRRSPSRRRAPCRC